MALGCYKITLIRVVKNDALGKKYLVYSSFPKGQLQCFHLDSETKITAFTVDGKTKKCDVEKTPLCWESESLSPVAASALRKPHASTGGRGPASD